MARPSFLKRIATLVAMALLYAQVAIAAYACPAYATPAPADTVAKTTAVAMPNCHEPLGALDPTSPNLCAEHCKQGQQSERASFSVVVPPALLNALYAMPAVPVLAPHPPLAGAWLSALVAASPPHAIAHCVLRI